MIALAQRIPISSLLLTMSYHVACLLCICIYLNHFADSKNNVTCCVVLHLDNSYAVAKWPTGLLVVPLQILQVCYVLIFISEAAKVFWRKK